MFSFVFVLYNLSPMKLQKRSLLRSFKLGCLNLILQGRNAFGKFFCFLIICLSSLIFSWSMLRAQSLTVFAAASLKQPLDRIGREYGAAMELDLRISYAASSVLARQIEFGAPADVFVSANLGWMKHLRVKNMLHEPAQNVALNSLVIAAQSGATPQNNLSLAAPDLISRLGSGRLGVPLMDAVPLGLYTKQALTELHLIEPLSTYIVQQDNARSTLMSLLRGEIELAVLYASDVAANSGIISVVAIPSRLHDTVTYTVAPITSSGGNFAHYLTSPRAQAIFVEYGFLPP